MLRSGTLLLVIARALANPAAGLEHVPTDHVRSSETWVLQLLLEGESQSPTFKSVVDALGRTNVIVYVQPGVCSFGGFHACLPPYVASKAGGARYLRVTFESRRTPRRKTLALIGHELQHALEVARAPNVRSAADIEELFQRIGFSPGCPKDALEKCFETTAAREVENRILRDLRR